MIPVNVAFRHMDVSEAVRDDIESRAQELEGVFNHIIACDAVVSLPHKHRARGKIPHLLLKLKVPGKTLVVDREPEIDTSHKDMYVVIADAFHSLKRQLEEHVQFLHGDVKLHAEA